jgi:hypothetical protein
MPSYLTTEDVQNYGSDLVDFSQRAAVHALGPHLQQIHEDNAELRRRLAVESRARLDQRVEAAIPDFRNIDTDPRWHRWLLSIDPLSSRIRQTLLNEAIAAADAPRTISFFRKFLSEVGAGGTPSAVYGRAGSSGKPVYTRSQIARLYDQHRRGAYVGREAEWRRQEADIIAAGREGRVLCSVDLSGK